MEPHFKKTFMTNYKASNDLSLPASVTPKEHAVFHHVAEFIEKRNSPLGLCSKQATEAMHSKFKNHWDHYKQCQSHPEYEAQLFRCVVDYNSKHI